MLKPAEKKLKNCGDGISIVGTSEAFPDTPREMTSGDDFRKTTIQTGGNSSAIGPNGFVSGDGSYGANAGIEKSGASAYGEVSGSRKYSGINQGMELAMELPIPQSLRRRTASKARTHTHSYSSASGTISCVNKLDGKNYSSRPHFQGRRNQMEEKYLAAFLALIILLAADAASTDTDSKSDSNSEASSVINTTSIDNSRSPAQILTPTKLDGSFITVPQLGFGIRNWEIQFRKTLL